MCPKDFIPFFYLRSGEEKHKVDFKALMQGLVVAGITSTIIMYRDQATLEVKINAIRSDVIEIRKNVDQMHQDFYIPRSEGVK